MPQKDFFGFSAVKENGPHRAMAIQQGHKIVDLEIIHFDCAVETAGPDATRDNIPEPNSGPIQDLKSLRIGKVGTGRKQLAHDSPECILLAGIVLLAFERSDAWHRAQDQYAGVGPNGGRKSGNSVHTAILAMLADAGDWNRLITGSLCLPAVMR
jgi:hypothetical protein